MKKRKNTILWFILLYILVLIPISLTAQDTRDPGSGFALFSMTFESIWSQETHPHPSGALHPQSHWSDLVGVTHNNQVTFLAMGTPASTGVQNIAELGNSTVFFQEVQQAITEGTAHNALDFGDLDMATGVIQGQFEANPEFPFVTMLSMIAPSPDWMIAVHNIDLQDENGFWKEESSIDVFPYDAGTDSGIDYTSNDQVTNPVVVITSLQGVTPFSNQKMGTITITLLGVLGTEEQEVTNRISIVPNPSNGLITLNNRNGLHQKVTIYNTLGQVVYDTTVSASTQTIDLTHLETGMYFIQNIAEGNQSTQKLIIK